jgi:CHAT domain-containing protein
MRYADVLKNACTGTAGITAIILVMFFLFCPAGGSTFAQEVSAPGETSAGLSGASSDFDFLLQQGLQAYRQGDFPHALKALSKARDQAEQEGDRGKQFDSLLYLSDVYQSLGFIYKQQQTLLLARSLGDEPGISRRMPGLYPRLANAYMSAGQYKEAEDSLHTALEVARSAGQEGLVAAIWNDYGNLYIARGDVKAAEEFFQKSKERAAKTGNHLLASRAGLNLVRTLIEWSNTIDEKRITALVDEATASTAAMDNTYQKAGNYLSIGELLRKAQQKFGGPASWRINAYYAFLKALEISEDLNNHRVSSLALGHLGILYKDEGRYEEALAYAQRAIFSAQQAHASESLYRWEWLMARLLRELGRTEEAIAAYREAMATLQKIRLSLIGSDRSAFKEVVAPVFFEFADLLLSRTATLTDKETIQETLLEVRSILEQLKVAEVEDYFQHECALPPGETTQLEQVPVNSAVLYPVVLHDRVELLLSLPDGLKQFTTPVGFGALSEEALLFRRSMEHPDNSDTYIPHARNLYTWLIAPLEEELQRQEITTIVFIPGGVLRSIPVSALHDGEKFLIEKYAVATTIGLDLTRPHRFKRKNVEVLLNGLTEPVQDQVPLPYVGIELDNIRKLYPSSKMLKDETYTLADVKKEMSQGTYSIVHIASHGHFDRDYKKSYILTFDDKLTVDRLEQTVGLRRYEDSPLDLLVLSACETAAGDDRAALGLAGIALKAGAGSALATLWLVNDEATAELVSEFYRQMKDQKDISLAGALQKAQITLIHGKGYRHPNLWAPFLVIGNWM